jgi:hypothetical protein
MKKKKDCKMNTWPIQFHGPLGQEPIVNHKWVPLFKCTLKVNCPLTTFQSLTNGFPLREGRGAFFGSSIFLILKKPCVQEVIALSLKCLHRNAIMFSLCGSKFGFGRTLGVSIEFH